MSKDPPHAVYRRGHILLQMETGSLGPQAWSLCCCLHHSYAGVDGIVL